MKYQRNSKFIAFSVALLTVIFCPFSQAGSAPSNLYITFYEMGFRDSTTGERVPIFKNSNGKIINLITNKGISELANEVKLNSEDWYSQIYFVTSNRPTVSGNNGSGCYIKSGTFTTDDAEWNALTTNESEAGEATLVESLFTEDNGTTRGPVGAVVKAAVNGGESQRIELFLTDDNLEDNTPYTRYLHFSNLVTPINLKSKTDGTIWVEFNTDEAMDFGSECVTFMWDKLLFSITIE